MKRVAAILAVVVLSACGGGGSESADTTTTTDGEAVQLPLTPDDLPDCDDLYADGVTTSEDQAGSPCQRDGENIVPGTADEQCGDGRTLLWNDEGWGYLGEPWNRHPDGGPFVPPSAELEGCTGA